MLTVMGRGQTKGVDKEAFFARCQEMTEAIEAAETLEEKETLRIESYNWGPGSILEATGAEIPAVDGKQPLEQVSEYLQQRAEEKHDIFCWPAEKSYSSPLERISPFLVLANGDAAPNDFPARIAGVKIVIMRVQAPEPL